MRSYWDNNCTTIFCQHGCLRWHRLLRKTGRSCWGWIFCWRPLCSGDDQPAMFWVSLFPDCCFCSRHDSGIRFRRRICSRCPLFQLELLLYHIQVGSYLYECLSNFSIDFKSLLFHQKLIRRDELISFYFSGPFDW